MPDADGLNAVVKALFVDVDVDEALAVLKELKLPIEYSDEAVAAINAEANRLADEASELKKNGAPQAKRQAAGDKVDRVVNARSFVYRLRPARPGDVTVTALPVGGKD
jgi:hypothetical protein